MAYAIVDSLTQTISRILKQDEQYPISDDGKQLIESLSLNIALLRGFLEGSKEEEGMSLETRIRDAANRTEDVMEHLMYEHLRSKARTDINLYDFRELQNAMREINSIAQEVEIVQHGGRRPATQPGTSLSSKTLSPIVDTVTVGLEERVEEIRGLLCGGSSAQKIITITGMGGIGKTTLAISVYEDEQVVNNFPVRAWIVASQNYKIENIFEELLFSLEKQVEKGLVNDGDTVEDKLHRILRLNKYLIVVDDLWSAKAWDDIRKGFGNTNKLDGSRIIITTRDEDVASHASSSKKPHRMDLMDERLSWSLLKQNLFPHTKLAPDMEKIARKVAKSCGGLPLAIVIVAGILSTVDKNPTSWEAIAEDVYRVIVEDHRFQNSFASTYTNLPHRLRPCFLYMSGFPEDHDIRISKLIKLYIAEGFTISEKEAEDCFNHLVRKNLVLVTQIKSNGRIKSCRLHNLVRHLFVIKAIDENCERRLSNSHIDLRGLARGYASTLRSVISFRPNESSLRGLRKFKLLRVLDVEDTNAYSLPASVFELFHLRYLAFGCPMEVPSSISRLQNLRTLIIRPSKRSRKYSTDEVYLPLEIWMMPLLNHLVSFFDLLPDPEEAASSSALKELLTLSVVKKLICTKGMMKLIRNVEKLAITYFGDIYKQDYQLNNLVLLTQLEKLTLVQVVKKDSQPVAKTKPVFPKTLKKLTLSGWRFPWKDMRAIAALPRLQVLKLRDHAFEGNTWNTFGKNNEVNVKLEYLLIGESDLQEWVTSKHHFPALKRLVLNGCGKLSEIPNAVGDMFELKLIEVDQTNVSLLKCVEEIQNEQMGYGKVLEVREL